MLGRLNTLKRIVKEARNIIAWQETIYTALHNIHADWVVSGRFGMVRMPDMALNKIMVGQGADNSPVEENKYTDADVLAIIAAKLKAGNVTDTTGADGKISVTFAEAFASTPVVTVQLEGDVDYYCVVTAKSTTGFTIKMLRTYHKHSQGNTGGESAHTHGISFASGAGSAHKHTVPNTSLVSAGTPAGTISGESSHTHDISFASGAGSSHRHSNPSTGYKTAGTPAGTIGGEALHTHGFTSGAGSAHKHTVPDTGTPTDIATGIIVTASTKYCAETSGGPTTHEFFSIDWLILKSFATNLHYHHIADTGNESSHTHSGTTGGGSSHNHSFSGSEMSSHRHTVGSTGYESSHTHDVSGTSGAGSSHNHTFTGSALGTHSHTIADTGNESSHTHDVSGTSAAGSSHSHTNPDTSEVNAGNLLATTEVTFSYIAMIP